MKLKDFTNKVIMVHIDEVVCKTDQAVKVRIDDRHYWLPRSVCMGGKKHTSRTQAPFSQFLLFPSWYDGDILAIDHAGHPINLQSIEHIDTLKNSYKGGN